MAEKKPALAALRERIRRLERLGGHKPQESRALPLLPALDQLWPEQGLPLGCLHEARSNGSIAGQAALTAFAGALGGRLGLAQRGSVLWCARRKDGLSSAFYAPGLAQVGLTPDRLLAVTASSDQDILAVLEEALRHPVLACVVGEVARLDLTASRRLQLAAEKSGVTAFVLRTPPKQGRAAVAINEPIAAAGRWRITAHPSAPHVLPEAGQPRWKLELLQSRCGATGEWIVEAPDAQGHLHLSAPLGDGMSQAPAQAEWHLAAG